MPQHFTAGPRQTSIRGQTIGQVLRERVGPLEATEEQIGQIMGSMPMGIAGTVGRIAKRALGGSAQQTLIPSELTRLKLLVDSQAKLQTIASKEIKLGSASEKARRSLIDLDEVSEEITKLLTTALNRAKNLKLFGSR